jgi:hypothetical protein
MLWSKFTEFTATHLELAPCLSEQLEFYSKNEDTKRRTVERNLEYIAVRPWESLDLSLAGSHVRGDKAETNVTYVVYAHIEGEEPPCSRARYVSKTGNVDIQGVIDHYKEWHPIYWAKQENRPLVFDAVVRRTRLVHYRPTEWDINKVGLSFYLFPEGFNS